VFIGGETLSAHSARPREIPAWIALVPEILFSVNKRATIEKNNGKTQFVVFEYIWLLLLSSKNVENNSIGFLN